TKLNQGEWYYVAMTREGDDVSVYLNGEIEISTTTMLPTGTWSNGDWAFGGRVDLSGQQKFAGNIDEIAIYGYALSPDEVFQHWYAANVPEPSSMVMALLALVGFVVVARRRKK
ncbi:MAG TPA: LamG-like jellyroll fold domain-containing protein, partial [Phycisphaerae bacterium]|nr:LamG-like jellyroll fold domain-containing protein [Phycisphaerae bacterium]